MHYWVGFEGIPKIYMCIFVKYGGFFEGSSFNGGRINRFCRGLGLMGGGGVFTPPMFSSIAVGILGLIL